MFPLDKGIGKFRLQVEGIRRKIVEGQLNALREILPDKEIERVCREVDYTYRERLMTPMATVLHYLMAGLWPEESFQAAATSGGIPLGSGSLSKARQRLPLEVMSGLSSWVSKEAIRHAAPHAYHHGLRVVTIDGTCVSMEDQPSLFEAFGRVNTRHGEGKYPMARLVLACLAKTMTVVTHRLASYQTSEQALVPEMLPDLQPGDLLIADAHFAASNLYAQFQEHGLHFITPAHQRLKVGRFRKRWRNAPGDFVAEVPTWLCQRRKYPFMPEKLTLRFIRVEMFSRRGKKMHYLVTSLLDPIRYPARLILEFYQMRWPVETVFKELKVPLSADVLRSKTPEGIRKEVAAKVMAFNLIRCLMLQAASRSGRDPLRLSFAAALRLAVSYSLRMSAAPVWQLQGLYDEMIDRMAGATTPYRPGRAEPRGVRRERKHYERLKITRAEWRRQYAIGA